MYLDHLLSVSKTCAHPIIMSLLIARVKATLNLCKKFDNVLVLNSITIKYKINTNSILVKSGEILHVVMRPRQYQLFRVKNK